MPNHFYGPRGGQGLFKTNEGSDENNLANTIGERGEGVWDWGQISIHHLQEGTRPGLSPIPLLSLPSIPYWYYKVRKRVCARGRESSLPVLLRGCDRGALLGFDIY